MIINFIYNFFIELINNFIRSVDNIIYNLFSVILCVTFMLYTFLIYLISFVTLFSMNRITYSLKLQKAKG